MYSPKCPDRYCHCFKWYSVFNDGGEQSLIFHEVCSTCFDLDNLFPVCWVNKLPIIIALPSPILELALKKWHNSHLLWWCFTTFQRPECDLKGWYIFSMQLQCSSQLLDLLEGFHLLRISFGKTKQKLTSSNALRLNFWPLPRARREMSGTDGNLSKLPLQSNLDLRPDILSHL